MQSPSSQTEGSDSVPDAVPGRVLSTPNIVTRTVKSVTTSTIHECQLNAGHLSDEDRQLFRKAIHVVSMETDNIIKRRMAVKILTDTRQFVVKSGNGSNKMLIFRDDENQIVCRRKFTSARSTAQKHNMEVMSMSPAAIHNCQLTIGPLTDRDRQLFQRAISWARENSSNEDYIESVKIQILADTCQVSIRHEECDDPDDKILIYRDESDCIMCETL